MDKEEAMKILKDFHDKSALFSVRTALDTIFPELCESEDEKIRKDLITFLDDIWHLGKNANFDKWGKADCSAWIAWLEKQKEYELSKDLGEYVTELNKQFPEVSFAKLSRIAVKVKNWLEKQGKQRANLIDIDAMVLKYSNTREKETNGLPVNCQIRSYRQGINDTLNLSLNIEKQGEQKPVSKEYTFKSIPRLLDMIEPTDRAKSYCKKLIDSLQTEGYSVDAKIVGECLKQMNGEKVAMAVMDNEKQDEKKSQRMVSAEAKEALYDKPTDEEMKELLRTEYEKGRADTIGDLWPEWFDAKVSDNSIEYTRTDTFIEKTEEFLYEKLNNGEMECGDIVKFISDFKKNLKC